MLLQFFGIFLISISSATQIVLDTEQDIHQDKRWMTANCSYEEIYTDYNKLQCKMKTMDATEKTSQPDLNMTGFWTPCSDPWCEVSYTFNNSLPSRHKVSVKGYMEGNSSIEVQLGQHDGNYNYTQTTIIGKLPNSNGNQWTEASFDLGNITDNSVRIFI